MGVNIKLGPRREAPSTDPMEREWVGWYDGITDAEIYKNNRGRWVFGARAHRERWATFSHEGRVVAVMEIDGIETIHPKIATDRVKSALVGRMLGPGDELYDALIGTPVDGHRNPVTYIERPDARERVCACGCGTTVAPSRVFAPGHDQRAVHDRIAQGWGGTVGFLEWFDRSEFAQTQ